MTDDKDRRAELRELRSEVDALHHLVGNDAVVARDRLFRQPL